MGQEINTTISEKVDFTEIPGLIQLFCSSHSVLLILFNSKNAFYPSYLTLSSYQPLKKISSIVF